MALGWLDGSILIAYVAALASIGWWAAHRTQKTTDDYFLANRSIHWLITMASFVATCISALTFVGTTGEGYANDYRYLLSNIGDFAAIVFISTVFLPHFQRLRVTSIYQAVAERFGPSTRSVCSAYFILTRTLASTVRIVAIAKVLEVVSGGALSFPWCVVLTVGCILSYTTMGGGRAIAFTDLLQFCLLITGAVASLAYIVSQVPGGVPTIVELGRHAIKPDGTVYNKFNFLEMLKPHNLWLLFLMTTWGFFNSSAAYGTDQDMVQRLLACSDERKARWSLLFGGVISGIPIAFTFLSIGAALYAYAHFHPEFIAGMTDTDHVFPRFILTAMPHGLRGLLFAAVASAAMGSSDSALAALSTALIIDFYKPFIAPGASEEQCVKVSKLAFVGFGLLFIVFALAMHNLDNILWLAFRMIAFTYGPLLGVFLVAILTDWKVPAKPLIVLMISWTVLAFSLAMVAFSYWKGGGTGFLADIHTRYWQFFTIFGALIIPAGAYLMRETT